ncbi:MAG TPA: insulinase family protein [Pirellulales bacterium]|nr:insulinase family protein [Pirellulales bacterium]
MITTLKTIVLFLGIAICAYAEEAHAAMIAKGTATALPTVKPGGTAKPWPHEGSDLKPDPRIVWGKLDNGLRYVILPTQAAPTRASLRLYMDVGSLMETDDERGLAHFLEHLAFCGTKHFPAGEVFEHFQRLGMQSGADTNAFTTFDRTVYHLELPRANEELLDDGFTMFRDFLDGMLFDQKQIDRERGVVLSEIVYRDSAEYRANMESTQFELPEALFSRRWPTGDPASVRAINRQQLVDFYQTWYTPGRATVVAVGDFDVKLVQRLIQQRFQDAKAIRGEHADPAMGKAALGQGELAKLRTDADLQTVAVQLCSAKPAPTSGDSVAAERHEHAIGMALAILNSRLNKIAAMENSSVLSANISSDVLCHLSEITSLTATCQPTKVNAAIGMLEQEMRRALLYGFTDAEFAGMKTTISSIMQSLADRAETQPPNKLADEIVSSLVDKTVEISPSDKLAMVNRFMPEVTKEECLAALANNWDSANLRIWVQGNVKLEGDASQQILSAYHASQQVKVSKPVDESAGTFAYTDFGKPGVIVKRNDQRDLGVVEAVFANNVHVNIKRTAFEKNVVRVLIRFGGGKLELPSDKPGLLLLANCAFFTGGLQAHSITDLAQLTGDKKLCARFNVGDDAFDIGGACEPETIDTQLQLCTAYLTAPGFRQEGLTNYQHTVDAIFSNVEHTAEGAVATQGDRLLHGGDPRFGLDSREKLQQLTLDDLKAWLSRPLEKGYLEVSLVGDIDPDTALSAVAKTLGALPARDAVKPDFAKQRIVKYPSTLKTKEIQFASEATRAMSVVCWPTAGFRDLPLSHRIDVLAAILKDRLWNKVRKELGATYTPAVTNSGSEVFPDFGFLEADLVVEAPQLPRIGQLVANIADELATGSISDDEFNRALKPIVSGIEEQVNNNSYWLSVISDCQENPAALDIVRKSAGDYRSITKLEIESVAKQYLTTNKATIISVGPTAPSSNIKPIESTTPIAP